MPEISVIIPVYNTEKYLPTCLDSVLRQTFQDFEIICINDGSTDNCCDILKRYADADQRIKVISQQNQGQALARNSGLDRASGKYIFFLDSDDKLPEYALETLFKIALKTQAPLVASRKLNEEKNKNLKFEYQIHRNALADFVKDKHIFSISCNKLYRADILKNQRFIPGIYFEDWPFLMMLMGNIDFYATTDISCYTYNEGNFSTTRSDFNQKKVDSYLKGIQCVYDFYKNRHDLYLAQKRMAVAVKMMVGKVYKTKNKELTHYTLAGLNNFFQKGVIHQWQLPLKTIFRLWKMKIF